MIDEVIACLDRSFEKLKSVCPQSDILSGMMVRDQYHKGDYSMLTLFQMLWAVASSSKPKTYYLMTELLKQVNYEIEQGHFYKNNDRVFSDAFILLALTYSGQPVNSHVYTLAVETLLGKQTAEGSWGTYYNNGTGNIDIRATSFSILALSECYYYTCPSDITPYCSIFDSINKGVSWLEAQYKDGKYCERTVRSLEATSSSKIPAAELTAFSSMAILKSLRCLSSNNIVIDKYKALVATSIKWLVSLDCDEVALKLEIDEEIYTDNNELLNHEYGTGCLDIIVCLLSEFLISQYYIYIPKLKKKLVKFVQRLMKNEKNGEWYDKNTSSYNRLWPISYAIVSLTNYLKYMNIIVSYKETQRKNRLDMFLGIKYFIFKFLLNPTLCVIYIIIAVVVFYFHEFIQNRIEFINSTAVSIAALLVGLIGLIFPKIGNFYERRK